MSTSADGVTWSALRRIPIDPVGSGVDHFIPGLAVPVVAVAQAPSGSVLNQVMASQRLLATSGSVAAAQIAPATRRDQAPAAADPASKDRVSKRR
jgi:hypothetical protein